jgi:hypothetical protein
MDVTVSIPPALSACCEGRKSIVLGVPPNTAPAEVLATVLALYPSLMQHVVRDTRQSHVYFTAAATARVITLFAHSIKRRES